MNVFSNALCSWTPIFSEFISASGRLSMIRVVLTSTCFAFLLSDQAYRNLHLSVSLMNFIILFSAPYFPHSPIVTLSRWFTTYSSHSLIYHSIVRPTPQILNTNTPNSQKNRAHTRMSSSTVLRRRLSQSHTAQHSTNYTQNCALFQCQPHMQYARPCGWHTKAVHANLCKISRAASA